MDFNSGTRSSSDEITAHLQGQEVITIRFSEGQWRIGSISGLSDLNDLAAARDQLAVQLAAVNIAVNKQARLEAKQRQAKAAQ